MAVLKWSLATTTVVLVWWISTVARGSAINNNHHQKYHWGHRGTNSNATNGSYRRALRSIAEDAGLKHRSKRAAPIRLQQILREGEWRGSPMTSDGGQKETSLGLAPNNNKEWSATTWQQNDLNDALALHGRQLRQEPQHGSRKRWLDLFGGSSVESRFPLPERRKFPEVDWRGFNEDVFHESFGDFSPVKRYRQKKSAASIN